MTLSVSSSLSQGGIERWWCIYISDLLLNWAIYIYLLAIVEVRLLDIYNFDGEIAYVNCLE